MVLRTTKTPDEVHSIIMLCRGESSVGVAQLVLRAVAHRERGICKEREEAGSLELVLMRTERSDGGLVYWEFREREKPKAYR